MAAGWRPKTGAAAAAQATESEKRAIGPISISRTSRSAEETASARTARAGARKASKSDQTAASGRGAAMGSRWMVRERLERERVGTHGDWVSSSGAINYDGARHFGEGAIAVIGLRGFDGNAGGDGTQCLR